MLRTSNSLINRPVMSLRSGSPVAMAINPIINPENLKILGWWCSVNGSKQQAVLLSDDVREIMPNGLAINDEADLSLPADLHRHREMLEIHFELIDKTVKTKRHKLGKVSDYSYEDNGLFIQKLYVTKPLRKVFINEDTLIIDRAQILEITNDYILVDDAEIKAEAEDAIPAPAPVSPA